MIWIHLRAESRTKNGLVKNLIRQFYLKHDSIAHVPSVSGVEGSAWISSSARKSNCVVAGETAANITEELGKTTIVLEA